MNNFNTWIFDLDNTIYSASLNIFPQITTRILNYMTSRLGITYDEAFKLQKRYVIEYGVTVSGLVKDFKIDAEDFLNYVHQIDLEEIKPDQELTTALKSLSGRKIVYTNGVYEHAARILKKMELFELFEAIYDLRMADYIPKPQITAYKQFVKKYDFDPKKACMFDDMTHNLEPAAKVGMKTAWINAELEWSKVLGVKETTSFRPDFVASSLTEALKIIKGE